MTDSKEYVSVTIKEELAKRIDQILPKLKDQLGLQRFRSRAELIEEAIKHFLIEEASS